MSATISLFALAEAVARRHEQNPSGKVTVIPVLVEDLSVALPVLRAICEVTQGRLLDTGEAQLEAPVPGTGDPVRRQAVASALTTTGLDARRVDLVEVENGLMDAVFDPPAGSLPSPGERTVLAIARAAAHRDLDEHELAIIAYRDTLMDFPFRRAVWNLGVKQLPDLPHGTLRTLVFVAESPINIDMHCQPRLGFRLAIDSGRLLRRHGPDDLQMAAGSIASLADGFVLFLGAGFAASSRLPMGDALRDRAIRRLLAISDSDAQTSEQLAVRFHNWISDRPNWLSQAERNMPQVEYVAQLTLEQVIRAEQHVYPELPTLAEFRAHHDDVIGTPGSAPRDLGAILEQCDGRIIVAEVNFDRLVETHASVPLKVFASDEEFAGAADYVTRYLSGEEKDVPLLKFHGSIDRPETCIVSAEQTERGVPVGKLNALRALIDQDRPRVWIYVGVSMRDQDLLRVFNAPDFGNGVDERWVIPYLPDTVEAYGLNQEPFWRNRPLNTFEDRLTTETADAFFAALRHAWPGPV